MDTAFHVNFATTERIYLSFSTFWWYNYIKPDSVSLHFETLRNRTKTWQKSLLIKFWYPDAVKVMISFIKIDELSLSSRNHNQELLACIASVSMGLGSKESQRNGIFSVLPARKMVREPKRGKRGRGRKEGKFPSFSSPTLSFFGSCPIFCAGKTPKIPFLCLFFAPKPHGNTCYAG